MNDYLYLCWTEESSTNLRDLMYIKADNAFEAAKKYQELFGVTECRVVSNISINTYKKENMPKYD